MRDRIAEGLEFFVLALQFVHKGGAGLRQLACGTRLGSLHFFCGAVPRECWRFSSSNCLRREAARANSGLEHLELTRF